MPSTERLSSTSTLWMVFLFLYTQKDSTPLRSFRNTFLMYTCYMNSKHTRASLLFLVLTSFICSRSIFYFIDDPEGPNLLVVTGMAFILYFLSSILYSFAISSLSRKGINRIVLIISIQILLAVTFYFCLN